MDNTIFYEANCSGIEKGKSTEMGFNITYVGISDDHAVQQAIWFLKNRCEAFDLTPGCIKVSHLDIRSIGEDGVHQTRSDFRFFEWKCDTSPYTLHDLLSSPDARKR